VAFSSFVSVASKSELFGRLALLDQGLGSPLVEQPVPKKPPKDGELNKFTFLPPSSHPQTLALFPSFTIF
jgi:hypothetical protein